MTLMMLRPGEQAPSTLRGRALLRLGVWTWALNDVSERGHLVNIDRVLVVD
jgi:hypothetical protein